MGAVQDPRFWKRFSVAVHQDDVDLEAAGGQREKKQS